MTRIRSGRQKYYDLFSHGYDAFIRLHSRGDENETRHFLVKAAGLRQNDSPRVLDICTGTGSVILAFARHYPRGFLIGYDFSWGMLRQASRKSFAGWVKFIQGDATALPFDEDIFDVVTCSHALYELKGPARQQALREMKRVVQPDGVVLIMEHEVPRNPVVKCLFNLRMKTMGSEDAKEFVAAGTKPFEKIFPTVSLGHSPSGKSKLIVCRK